MGAMNWVTAFCWETLHPALDAMVCSLQKAVPLPVPHDLVLPVLASTLLLLGALLWLVSRMLRIWTASRSRDFVNVAAAAQADLHVHAPHLHPQTPHAWSAAHVSSGAPAVCAVCFVPVVDSTDLQTCSHCSTVVHSSCARFMIPNCKPMALGGLQPLIGMPDRTPAPWPVHDWRPAGCVIPDQSQVMSLSQGTDSQNPWNGAGTHGLAVRTDLDGEILDAHEQCLFCQGPCEVGFFSVEPVWRCSMCRRYAHVQCFVSRHPELFSAHTRTQLQDQLNSSYEEDDELGGLFALPALTGLSWRSTRALPAQQPPTSGPPSPPLSEPSILGSHALARVTRVKGAPPTANRHSVEVSTSRPQRQSKAPSSSGKSVVAAPKDSKPTSNGSSQQHGSQESDGVPLSTLANGQGAQAYGSLDIDQCSLGPAGKAVLPATCVCLRAALSLSNAPSEQPSPSPSSASFVSRPVPNSKAAEPAVKRRGRSNAAQGTQGTSTPGSGFSRLVSAIEVNKKNQPGSEPAGSFESPPAFMESSQNLEPPPSPSPAMPPALQGLGSSTQVLSSAAVAAAAAASQVARRKTQSVAAQMASWWPRPSGSQHRWSQHALTELETWPPGVRPVLVFVNLKSGPQLGRTLLALALQLLHPLQVVELPKEDPIHALRFFSQVPFRILVVGGDGTVDWILSTLDKVAEEQGTGWAQPPVGVMPMGTGNDLARTLGWGGGMTGGQPAVSLINVLHEVKVAHAVPLDRWHVSLQARPSLARPTLKQLMRRGSAAVTQPAPEPPSRIMCNYLGIGADASVALQFHRMRESYPKLFQSQLGNKVWYGSIGAPDLLRRSCAALHARLHVTCDGVEVPVPEDAQGLIILNIGHHMGGVALWEDGLPAPPVPTALDATPAQRQAAAALTQPRRQALADGVLEVVAIGGPLHMGRLAVGLARAQRLAQCSTVTVTTTGDLPMQVDGEPWLQVPTTIVVTHKNQAPVLRRVPGGPLQRVAATLTEVLERGEQRGLISASQRAALAKDLALQLEPWLM